MRCALPPIMFAMSWFASQAAAATLAIEVDHAEAGVDPVWRQSTVTVSLTPEGRAAATEFSRLRIDEPVTMRVRDMKLTESVIRSPILQGTLMIGGAMTEQAASELARDLNSGARILFVDGSDK